MIIEPSPPRRRFNRSEHIALYLAADGYCASCGVELESGWHADHVTPLALGGTTDLINGQALCPPCNLAKGITVATQMRKWQQDVVDDYLAEASRDYLIEATPGSGKTKAAGVIARRLLDAGTVTLVVVVTPTDALRLQWADADPSLRLRPYTGDTVITKAGYDGIVITYAQLAQTGPQSTRELLRHRMSNTSSLAIFDEVHHAGESRSWAAGLQWAFDNATRRIALTGTPWRSDNNSIPFVRYEDGFVSPDFTYSYGQAVQDGVCRPVVINAYNGEARWQNFGAIVETTVDADIDDDMVSTALDTLYDPGQTWIPALLRTADQALTELRRDVPDAGALVVADRRWLAEKYAAILEEITGEAPCLVISEGPDNADAKKKLDDFRRATSRWIVAVRMVSEGIDIPRLSVGVYAAKTTTPLFYRQVVGRFIRARLGEEHNAELFIPAVPILMRHAYDIEQELRHELEEELEEHERKTREWQEWTFDLPIPLSTSAPLFDRAIQHGEAYEPADHEAGRAACERFGIPTNLAVNIARLLRDQALTSPVAQVVQPMAFDEPQHRLEKRLRSAVQALANRRDRRRALDGGTTNADLLRRGYPARKECTIDDLQKMREVLTAWLDEGQ